MKHFNYLFCSIVLSSFLIISCDKDDAKPEPVASFTMDKLEAEIGDTITFYNSSVNATNYLWDFGDESTSTNENPTHSYSDKDNYSITLTASGEGGINSISKNIQVVAKSLFGTWIGAYSDAEIGIGVRYELTEENGSVSGILIVVKITSSSYSQLSYLTNGTYDRATGKVILNGSGIDSEYNGTFDGKNDIQGEFKAIYLNKVTIDLERHE